MNMEALVIEPKTKENARFLRNFPKRTGANAIDDKHFWDKVSRRLKEEDLLDPDVSESKVIAALKDFFRQRGVSTKVDVDEFLEEYEDMVFSEMLVYRSKNAKMVSEAEFEKMVERKLAE